jgi:ribokinase
MTRPKICVVGASNLDLISYVPRLPRMGETLHGNRFHMGYGGKGANQAVMAAKLGGDVAMVTKLGQDIFGENTLKNFQSWDIDTASSRGILTRGTCSLPIRLSRAWRPLQ